MNRTKVLFLVTGLALLGGAAWFLLPDPANGPEKDLPTLLSEAQDLQRRKKFRSAAEKYGEVLRRDPGAYDALVGLGLSWQALGYDGRASEVLARAVKNRVGEISLDRAYARSLLATGQREKAIAILKPAYEKTGDKKTGLLLGDANYEWGLFRAAEKYYWDLLLKQVRSNKLILRLQRTLLINNGSARGLRAYIEPSGSLRLLIESTNLRWKGNLAGALESLDGNSPLFLRRKVHLLLEMGKYEEVLPLAEELQNRSRDHASITYRADAGVAKMLALLLLDRLTEAREFAALQLKELDPQVSWIREALAAFRFVVGKIDFDGYEKGFALAPVVSRNDVHILAALLARGRGEDSTFRACLEKARQETRGRDYPAFLIERLRKEQD